MKYRDLVASFTEWCRGNHILLNVTKTKEMVADFRRMRTVVDPINILGEEVEVVDMYKYLGVHFDNRLNWKCNTETVYKKGQSRLYFLRKFRSFNVSVCCCKYSFLCCNVLGQWHQSR